MEKSRIAALVDGIFAVAMTLLVLDLKPPEGVKLSSDAEVSIAVSFFNPSLALSAYWLLLAFHFLPGPASPSSGSKRLARNLTSQSAR